MSNCSFTVLHVFARHPAFYDATPRNKRLIRSSVSSLSHMDDYNRHILLGQCHCGSLRVLLLWYWSQWT